MSLGDDPDWMRGVDGDAAAVLAFDKKYASPGNVTALNANNPKPVPRYVPPPTASGPPIATMGVGDEPDWLKDVDDEPEIDKDKLAFQRKNSSFINPDGLDAMRQQARTRHGSMSLYKS